MITKSLKLNEIKKEWFIADAEDKTLGRFATAVAKVLRGKHKPSFTPNLDMGDFVIIINAEKIKVTGSKNVKKIFKKSWLRCPKTFTACLEACICYSYD